MNTVLWTGVILFTSFVIFTIIVIVLLVLFIRVLDDDADRPLPKIFSILGLEKPQKRVKNKNSFKEIGLGFLQMAIKYGLRISMAIADICSMKNVPLIEAKVTDSGMVSLNFTEMAGRLQLACKEYEVVTQDGYILRIFRVEGKGPPVLLLHGFLDSADTFILRGSVSLVYALTTVGYDVWVINFRGNKYSRKHLSLNRDKDYLFWQFSFHEFGVYDLPATINFILNKTGQSRLKIVSHSQGSTALFAMCSVLPKYNEKVALHVSMAPLCHMDNLQPPLTDLILSETFINILLRIMGREEFLGSYSHVLPTMRTLCSYRIIGKDLCLGGAFSFLFGRNENEVKADFMPMILAHYPAGTSLKNVNHMAQLYLRRKFSHYDYGFIMNAYVYSSFYPPPYDPTRATMKTVVFGSRADKVSTPGDIEMLMRELPNIVEYKMIDKSNVNHIDFVWGKNAHKYLYPQILEVLWKYN